MCPLYNNNNNKEKEKEEKKKKRAGVVSNWQCRVWDVGHRTLER